MSQHGPYLRLGTPGGPGCQVATLPVEGRASDGTIIAGALLDGGTASTEIELLRTVASGLGIRWGHDDFGWWAVVPQHPQSTFSARPTHFALFREDDNGARFLIAHFDSEEAAQQRAAELANGGHKQHYFIVPLPTEGDVEFMSCTTTNPRATAR